MYQKLTKKIAGKPEERILSFLMLRSLKQARYSEVNEGHFALAATSYTHFTSPIRRYPDLIVHRILKQVLRESPERWDGEVPIGSHSQALSPDREGHDFSRANQPAASSGTLVPEGTSSEAPSPWSKRRDHAAHAAANQPMKGPISIEELRNIADQSSQTERRADEAERDLMEWKKVKFMQDRVGEDFDALIISVTKFGFFVELTDLFVEGLVPLSTLIDDHYTYHENTREIIGHRSRRIFSLGQKVRVLLDRIDPVEKKLQFALWEEVKKPRKRR
jgi:ribonuclease R